MRIPNRTSCGRIGMVLTLLCWITVPADSAQPGGFDPFAGETRPAQAQSQPAPPEGLPSAAIASATSLQNLGPTIGRVQFNNDDLNLVFQVVSDVSGWSIFPGAKVVGKITLFAHDITAGDLLDTAVRMAGFIYVKQGEIVSVMTYEDYMLYYGVVKRTFTLQYRDAMQVAGVLTPFVTPRGRLIPDAATRTLVIYEVPTNLPLLEDIVRKIDLPADSKIVKVIKLIYADADTLADHLQSVFGSEQKQPGPAATAVITRAAPPPASQPILTNADALLSAEQGLIIYPVARTNHVILRGYPADVARVEELIAAIDIPADLETRHYQVIHLDAADVLASLEESLGVYSSMSASGGGRGRGGRPPSGGVRRSQPGAGGARGGGMPGGAEERIRLSYLEEGNAIVVTAPANVHRQVAEFLDAVAEGRQPRPSGEDGRVVMRVVEDAYRSGGER